MSKERNLYILSVQCMTYNQSAYITDTLNGFTMQQTNFPFVAVIVDDASTDGEQEVIRNYVNDHFDHSLDSGFKEWETDDAYWAFARHKENVNCHFVVAFLKKNLYKQQEKKEMVIRDWMNSKYIALCEGDDYWIDPLKLQKQVDFLEEHESYSMCFTNCIVDHGGKRDYGNVAIWDTYTSQDILLHNSLDMVKRGDRVVSPGHTSTFVYRRPSESLPVWISKCFIGDEPTFIAISKYGKAKFINEATSVYRQNVGVSSRNFSFESDCRSRIEMYKLIDEGFDYKYHRLISSKIIARYYKKLTKIAFRNKDYLRSVGYLFNYIKNSVK